MIYVYDIIDRLTFWPSVFAYSAHFELLKTSLIVSHILENNLKDLNLATKFISDVIKAAFILEMTFLQYFDNMERGCFCPSPSPQKNNNQPRSVLSKC